MEGSFVMMPPLHQLLSPVLSRTEPDEFRTVEFLEKKISFDQEWSLRVKMPPSHVVSVDPPFLVDLFHLESTDMKVDMFKPTCETRYERTLSSPSQNCI